jgi:hypothetical protein
MEAKDWLKGVEKKLVIAQCTDHEKVLFATHQLYERQPTGGRRTETPMRTSTPSCGMSSSPFLYSLCASWHHEVEEEGIHRPKTRQYDSE